jgi:hypothetical protein
LAKRENVYCKISGLMTEVDWSMWTEAQLRPYFETVMEAFGPGRVWDWLLRLPSLAEKKGKTSVIFDFVIVHRPS